MNRRRFLKKSACSAALGISGCALAGKTVSPATSARRKLGGNECIHIGIVGMGARGGNFVSAISQLIKQQSANVQLSAVCDIWRTAREQAVATVEEKTGSRPQSFARHQDLSLIHI